MCRVLIGLLLARLIPMRFLGDLHLGIMREGGVFGRSASGRLSSKTWISNWIVSMVMPSAMNTNGIHSGGAHVLSLTRPQTRLRAKKSTTARR